jgi:hypothetical protein
MFSRATILFATIPMQWYVNTNLHTTAYEFSIDQSSAAGEILFKINSSSFSFIDRLKMSSFECTFHFGEQGTKSGE